VVRDLFAIELDDVLAVNLRGPFLGSLDRPAAPLA
jgi:hypothetical protein